MPLQLRNAGNGPDLALLHGWGLGAGVWSGVADALAARCRVHLVSLPGYDGMAADADDAASFAAIAAALAGALPRGTTLCGWSLGGMLALAAAAAAPGHFARLALVGSTPSFVQREGWHAAQPPSLLDDFAANVAGDAAKTLARFVLLFAQGDTAARQVARTLTPLAAQATPATAMLLAGLDWLRTVDLRATLPQLDLPALLLHGERDPLMPLAAAAAMATALPHTHLETFAGAAHAPFVSDPARFVSLLAAFCHEPA